MTEYMSEQLKPGRIYVGFTLSHGIRGISSLWRGKHSDSSRLVHAERGIWQERHVSSGQNQEIAPSGPPQHPLLLVSKSQGLPNLLKQQCQLGTK